MQQSVNKASSSAGKKAQKRPKVQFKLVQQSYEDKDYEETPKPVLVPAALADHRRGKRRKDDHPMFVFGEDMPEDFSNRRNMLMTDDTRPGEEHLFDDEVEEEFDEDFIQQMMYGEVDEEDEDLFGDDDENDDDDGEYCDEEDGGEGAQGSAARPGRGRSKYAQHDTTTRAIDRQFTKAMREFEVDEGINDASVDDPRTHGPLDVDQYYAALEEFVEDHVAYSTETAEPLKNKGLIHQLRKLTHRNRVFDSNAGGVFYTTLLPDKKARFMAEFKEQTDEILRKARASLEEKRKREGVKEGQEHQQPGEEQHEGAPKTTTEEEAEETEQFEVVELEPRERFDCETILSTYSTLYNHPNIIAAAKKKVDPKRVVAVERSKQRNEVLQKKQQQHRREDGHDDAASASTEEGEEDEQTGPSTVKQLEELGIDVTVRPADESREEKKLRRQLIKTMQRERRQAKKALQSAYRDATLTAQVTAPEAKKAKGQVSLSLAAAAPRKR